MSSFRFATWNVEWFDRLFAGDGTPERSEERSTGHKITKARQLDAIATVMRAVDADAMLVIEAPDDGRDRSTRLALETFAEGAGLRTTRALIGFANDTRQEIALLYDPDRVTARHAPGTSTAAPRFDRLFAPDSRSDLDSDLRAETLVWSKPPLELDLETPAGPLHLIGVHAKSKAAHGAADAQDELRINILNRRKQLAQCVWLRARVDQRLAEGRSLIVAGDFNDGPGLDRFETLFGRSGVEIVLGDGAGALTDPHAIPPRIGAAMPATAHFWDTANRRFLNALLDFAMVSSGLRDRAAWRILHPFDDPEVGADGALRDALLDASDHFPVVLDLAARPAHFCGMKHLLVALALAVPLPALAQETSPPDAESPPTETMERGLRLFMDGLRDEMEPALRGLQGMAKDAAPMMRQLQESLGDVVDDLDAYAAPEIQPNGDILIRRKEPLPVDEPEPNADGSIDL